MVLLFFVPVLAALTTTPLLISQRLGGQRGLWIATLLVVTLLGWWRNADFSESAGQPALVAGALIAIVVAPAWVIDRASRRTPRPSVRRIFAYSIGSVYAGLAVVLLIAVLCLIAQVIVARMR
jgi:hypothetical protein